MSAETLTFDQAQGKRVIRERLQKIAWFLGFGASRTVGLPIASDIIWDLRRRCYCRQKNGAILVERPNREPAARSDSAGLEAPNFSVTTRSRSNSLIETAMRRPSKPNTSLVQRPARASKMTFRIFAAATTPTIARDHQRTAAKFA